MSLSPRIESTCCADCGRTLSPVFRHDTAPTVYQFEGALWVGLFGGYGMFVDEMTDWPGSGSEEKVLPGPPDVEVVLCRDCAQRLLDANPWLDRIVHRTSEN